MPACLPRMDPGGRTSIFGIGFPRLSSGIVTHNRYSHYYPHFCSSPGATPFFLTLEALSRADEKENARDSFIGPSRRYFRVMLLKNAPPAGDHGGGTLLPD